ncbi:hypothetical protein N7530_002359 [Penicillium desertorum]|uniref:Uncharacterized protein n=1 Tax=Penicillium desertorum TaxID=1303715 RepID=A0A9X0BSZ4_9EURO|nr:hypothetical protein N7530_012788 [Penicillium desertorum]KAJ5483113.1 hypothetical protein N7530_002359 [Penicillium desertorum]
MNSVTTVRASGASGSHLGGKRFYGQKELFSSRLVYPSAAGTRAGHESLSGWLGRRRTEASLIG